MTSYQIVSRLARCSAQIMRRDRWSIRRRHCTIVHEATAVIASSGSLQTARCVS